MNFQASTEQQHIVPNCFWVRWEKADLKKEKKEAVVPGRNGGTRGDAERVGDASTQKLLMSCLLQAATSAIKEWLVLHHLRKTQRAVWFFSSDLTFSQSNQLITAVIKDCACSRQPAAPVQVKKMRKTNEQRSPHLSTLLMVNKHAHKQSKSWSPAMCQKGGEGTESVFVQLAQNSQKNYIA